MVELEQSPQPWYKSKTIISGITSIIVGLGVASGYVSPDTSPVISSHLESLIGGIIALNGLVAIWGRSEVTKVAAGKGQGPVTISVPHGEIVPAAPVPVVIVGSHPPALPDPVGTNNASAPPVPSGEYDGR